jgi:glycosyltransferase involved in cell wall biosynthesis
MSSLSMKSFSVLMSVYKNENNQFLQASLSSIFNQSLQPAEVVVVKDGPLTKNLDATINSYIANYSNIKIVELPVNKGLGEALKIGLNHCNYDLVARMDADDIAHPNRFAEQIRVIGGESEVAAIGCNLSEFNVEPGDSKIIKKVPANSDELRKYAMLRNPLNHPSVVFRKSAIQKVGSYQHMPLFEDYYLWLRLLKAGYKIKNIDQTLLFFRAGNAALTRRHGSSYIKKELKFYSRCFKENLIPKQIVLLVLFLRLPFRLLPKKLFLRFYKILLRK